MNEQIQHTFLINHENAGQRLDLVLSSLLPDYSRSLMKKWIADQQVKVNDNYTKSSHKVQEGDIILIDATITPAFTIEPMAMEFNIIHEDEHIMVINKPAGLIVHPGAGNGSGTILNGLLHRFSDSKIIPRAGIVHRLDKDTTGLMVITKTLPSYYKMVEDIKERTVKREYEALCQGTIDIPGTIDEPIGRHPKNRVKMCVNTRGKTATTLYEVIQKFKSFTWLRLNLVTGRTHQIRVHLAHIFRPIVGDQTYGGKQRTSHLSDDMLTAINELSRQALHAKRLSFSHPITKEELSFEAPLPDDMLNLIQTLKNDDRENV